MNHRISGASVGLLVAVVGCLAISRATVIRLIAILRAPARSFAASGIDATAADLAFGIAWLLGAWVAVVLALAVTAALPGAAGAAARRCARAITPRALAGVLTAAAGTTLLAAPASAAPGSSGSSPVVPAATARALPSPVLPISPAAPTTPTAPAALPPRHAPQPPADDRSPTVVVRPGDSLWTIARTHAPPGAAAADVARSTTRWYAANRGVIGTDPDLIHPGQQLQPPAEPEQP